MKNTFPAFFLPALFATSISTQGALIEFFSFDADGTQPTYLLDGVNQGSSSPAVSVTKTFGNPTTFSFTLINDFDGGGVNDTLTFDFVYTIYTGSTINGGDVTLGTSQAIASPGNTHYGQYPTSDPDANAMQPGDSFQLGIQNISYTDGEGDEGSARFLGWEQFTKFGGGSGDLLLGTSSYSTLSVGASTGSVVDFNPSGDYVTGDLILTTAASASTSQRFRDLHFDFEIVPEPSAAALLGLGGFILISRRKRD